MRPPIDKDLGFLTPRKKTAGELEVEDLLVQELTPDLLRRYRREQQEYEALEREFFRVLGQPPAIANFLERGGWRYHGLEDVGKLMHVIDALGARLKQVVDEKDEIEQRLRALQTKDP